MNTLPSITAPVKPGTWAGLVVGDGGRHHRGAHAAVLRNDGSVLCVCGPVEDRRAVDDARKLAILLNAALELGLTASALN